MQLTINVAGTEQVRRMLLQIGSRATALALAQTAEQVERYVHAQAGKHTKTGALARSVDKRRLPGGAWEVFHDLQVAPQAKWVHWGTKPHVIRPKNKKALRWAGGGMFHFSKKVNHPGNKADLWMERAAALAPAMFQQHIAAQVALISKG